MIHVELESQSNGKRTYCLVQTTVLAGGMTRDLADHIMNLMNRDEARLNQHPIVPGKVNPATIYPGADRDAENQRRAQHEVNLKLDEFVREAARQPWDRNL